jgi:Raf kinase inhibitor-like YbhB/YbcL family protein
MNIKVKIKDFPKPNNLCENHGGKDICPEISWTSFEGAKSYALILDDIDLPNNGIFIHWYIPYISPSINKITELNCSDNINIYENINYSLIDYDKIKMLMGKNTLGKYGYHGPCNPFKVFHRYRFHVFALNDIFKMNNETNSIKSCDDFKKKVNKSGINILGKGSSKVFRYKKFN